MVLFWIVVVFLLAVLLGSFVTYQLTFAPKRRTAEEIMDSMPDKAQYAEHLDTMEKMFRDVLDTPYEDVWIETEDGLRLHGKYYHTADGAPLQIFFHGYRSIAEFDGCGALPFGRENGYNVLLVDQRAHGLSEGKCITFGIKESEDCVEWVDYARYRFGEDVRIILYGMSMGAATVLMATELDLPDNVECVIADCGYTSAKEIIQKVMRDRRLPVCIFYPIARLGAKIFGGFDLNAGSAQRAMKHCNIPVLFIHGEGDHFVPYQMSRKNYRRCRAEGRMLLLVPEAGHGMSYLTDKETYFDTVKTFLHNQRTCLKQ